MKENNQLINLHGIVTIEWARLCDIACLCACIFADSVLLLCFNKRAGVMFHALPHRVRSPKAYSCSRNVDVCTHECDGGWPACNSDVFWLQLPAHNEVWRRWVFVTAKYVQSQQTCAAQVKISGWVHLSEMQADVDSTKLLISKNGSRIHCHSVQKDQHAQQRYTKIR